MNKNEVIGFWFDEITPEQHFKKDEKFDRLIAERFGKSVEAALQGELENWKSDDAGQMALIILLDQFTRNIFRDTPKSFAGDKAALKFSLNAQKDGFLERNEQNWRNFLLMPMMHSEDIDVQNASLAIFQKYTASNTHEYAIKHRDIIAKYGRFPHRNIIIGRKSTPEELEFLSGPGSSF